MMGKVHFAALLQCDVCVCVCCTNVCTIKCTHIYFMMHSPTLRVCVYTHIWLCVCVCVCVCVSVLDTLDTLTSPPDLCMCVFFPPFCPVPGPCDPEDLIDGIIFAASYLGSTHLLSERTPSKSARMQQAQEAMHRVRVSSNCNTITSLPSLVFHTFLRFLFGFHWHIQLKKTTKIIIYNSTFSF